jgi:hypothetical protein
MTLRFLYKLALFLSLLWGIDQGLARFLDSGAPRDYRAFVESKEMFGTRRHVDVLFLGDSHIADAIVPSVYQEATGLKAFNYGVYHLSPLEGHYLLRDLLQRCREPPRIAVLGLNPVMFARGRSSGVYTPRLIRDPLIRAQLFLEAGDAPEGGDNLGTLTAAGDKWRFFLPALEILLDGRDERPVTREVRRIDRGYLENHKHLDATTACVEDSRLERAVGDADQKSHFEATIRRLQEQGIRVALVNPPVHRRRWPLVLASPAYADFAATIETMSERLDVPVFNLANEAGGSWPDDHYLEYEHLCHPGAVKFTRLVAAFLDRHFD